MYEYKALVTEVKDGDTISATIKLGCGILFEPWGGLRLNGINAPEIHDKDQEIQKRAQAAKDFISSKLLPSGERPEVKVITYKADQDNVLDKFGRLLADVFYQVKTETKKGKKVTVITSWASLNKELIDLGLVKAWDGKGEKPI